MNNKIINDAVEVFVYGASFTRSLTHPYIYERIDPAWVLRDAPRKSGQYRIEEWIAHGVDPVEMERIALKHSQNQFRLCTILDNDESDEEVHAAFKKMQYRRIVTESFMIHNLEQIPDVDHSAEIVRVEDEVLADRVNKAAWARQILPEHLAFADPLHAPIRQYAALVDDEIVGRVASILMRREDGNHAAWVNNMYVHPEFRRRGIARALMSRLLQDDRAAGAKQSILLATLKGAKLYPVLGYEQIGMMYIYTPKRD